jgi:uncharacterized protein
VKLRRTDWHGSAERSELLALYAEADALLGGWRCGCSDGGGSCSDAPCCHFGLIGREPHPTAVELEEVRHAMERTSVRRSPHKLPLAGPRPCPLLSKEGRCSIYASRPFGCRTFFCDDAAPPFDVRAKLPRASLRDIGRRIADLSARFAPRDPQPRALTRWLLQRTAPGPVP